jgi:hypothetical protein
MPIDNTYYSIDYRLELENGSVLSQSVDIHKDLQVSRLNEGEALPDWARLENGQCDNCSLSGSEYCPIAARLASPVQRFSALVSHAPVTATVTTPERTYVKKVDAQEALRSLFGLIMATSGCPTMKPFRYMARYHLPFSSLEETIARITSTYLLRQFYQHRDSYEIPVNLKDIEALYNTLVSLNEGMVKRLRGATMAEGSVNAVVILSAYSSLIPMMMEKELERLNRLFV